MYIAYRCCSCMMSQGFIKDDNCCRCNTSAIRKTTGIHQDDIVYASFHNKVSEIYIYAQVYYF